MIKVVINGKKVELEKPDTILKVCRTQGINIPTLCNDHRLEPHGACRICVVEVNGARNYPASCSTQITDGMDILTHSPKIIEARREILNLLLANHPTDCLTCEKASNCKLQDYCYEYDVKETKYIGERKPITVEDTNKFYNVYPDKCISCGKCQRVCSELQCSHAIDFKDRGFKTAVTRFSEYSDECVSCGNCVSICPVGALWSKSRESCRTWNTDRVKTTCPYCGVGCQMYLNLKDNKVFWVDPAFEKPNEGLLCVKGKYGFNFINHPDRLKKPLLKKNGKFVEITWDEAYNIMVHKFKETKSKYGPNAIAGLASAKVTNEENYLFMKFMRAVIGTNNVDHCARLCHASTVAGLATTLGSGAMTNSIAEIDGSDLFFISGSNTTEAHPIIGSKIKQAKAKGAKIIAAEPRLIELAKYADIFLQIRPGTNVALYNGMMHIIIKENLHDKEYIKERTENFEELKKMLQDYTPEKIAKICGINANDLKKAAIMYAQANKASIFYSMGVTQHSTGTEGVMSISNLAMITGNLGKESTGVNPLRGQNNVQGACDLGSLPNVYCGYQKVTDEKMNKKFEKAWDVEKLPNTLGLTVTEVITEADKGNVKLAYIMGENPMLSDPDLNHVKTSLEKLDFLVVQDIFLTETAELADLVLPAATFAEKDGTFTNTERRVQRVRKAVTPVGEAKADWEIITELMNRMGYKAVYNTPSDIMDEIASVTPQYAGISYERIEKKGLAWPCLDKEHPGTPYLHKDKFARGKGLLRPAEYKASNELPDEEFPFLLTTGRILYHFHTRTMSGKTDGLNEIEGHSFIEINTITADKMKIKDGEKIKVASRRGEVVSTARLDSTIKEDVVFMPFHFIDGPANVLTNPVLDPIAKIPEFKVCAVKINKIG
ncbi:formate dehydrogenase subunit alpha [bacterium]